MFYDVVWFFLECAFGVEDIWNHVYKRWILNTPVKEKERASR